MVARFVHASLALTAVFAVLPHALAQLAPNGAHYAGRSSDTGFGGSAVDATGSFPTAVKIDLPPSRAGLPLPLQVVYGAHRVGGAGLGWDVPLSYIQQDASFARRRPASPADAAPVPRQRTTLSLLGQDADLIPQNNQWVVRVGTLALSVRQSGSAWYAYDGVGRTYTFERPANLPNSGLWLLQSISGPGNSVVLTYQIGSVTVQGGTGWEIDLVHIAYNAHTFYNSSQFGCAKNNVVLSWSNTTGSKAPIGLSLLNGFVLARLNTLAQIDITARESCLSSPVRLRRYAFSYFPDPDTGLPRLDNVTMFGREGTPEETSSLPVASWQYGSATSAARTGGTRELRYGAPQFIKMPAGVVEDELAATVVDSATRAPESGDGYAMSQTLADFTGHGRTDLVFRKSNRLWIAKGAPAGATATTFGAGGVEALVPLSDDTFKGNSISTQSLTSRRFAYGAANRNTTDIWRQAIDVNGDGRLDIVDAGEEAGHWVIYLNTPGGPSGVSWKRRSFSIATLQKMLTADKAHALNGDYLPLSRQSTGTGVEVRQCWRWDGKQWNDFPKGFSSHSCKGNSNTILARSAELTYIEWQLADLNGDGYPDFVFDSSGVDFQVVPPPGTPKPVVGTIRNPEVWVPFAPAVGNQIRVAFNVLGVRFDTDREAFAQPLVLSQSPGAFISKWTCANLNSTGGCADSTHLIQQSGLADVNGDGLMDLVVGRQAYLGSFSGQALTFSTVYITLPGPLGTQINNHDAQCQIGKPQKPTTTQTQGLRDFTGDGIPDYYDASSNSFPASAGPPKLWIGTGTGFQSPIPIVTGGATFQFSHETETCDGKSSKTDGGLYDIDGDGKPDLVGLDGNSLVVSELTGGRAQGNPESGRITAVSSAAGAQTNLAYVSAKQFTDDSLPFPEIVVTSVSTQGTHNLGGSLDGVNYAFGRGEMMFNSALDRFVFPGYRKRIAVQLYKTPQKPIASPIAGQVSTPSTTGETSRLTGPVPIPLQQFMGIPTITNTVDLLPFSNAMTKQQRWLREHSVGQVSEVLNLRASANTDPWSLFLVAPSDGRVIGETKYEWDAKFFEAPVTPPANALDCFDVVSPFDFQQTLASLNSQSVDVCRAHGFIFPSSTTNWHGDAAPPSDQNVQTATQSLSVDDFGRSLLTRYQNDVFRGDDDVCVQHTYAAPVNPYPHVLSAMSSRRVYACGETNTLAGESWLYDTLPASSVSDGKITSHNIDQRATDTGELLKSIHDYDATYDAYGNIITVRSQRDNAIRTVTLGYDAFSLVPTRVDRDATGAASSVLGIQYDGISLLPLVLTDSNNNQHGVAYDGFGRAVRTTLTPVGGSAGVLSTTAYLGFDGTDPEGERISNAQFTDPVDPGSLGTASGRITLTHFDELGRPFRRDVSLGADYAGQWLITGWKAYDGAGRLSFAANPFAATESAANAYGQSLFYKDTGDLDCAVSSRGHLSFVVTATNSPSEQLPTCYKRSFSGHQELVDVRDASSLDASSPQAGTVKRFIRSAVGLTLSQSAYRGLFHLEEESFAYDRLGQRTSLTRFLDPLHNTEPVQWTLRRDSLGRTLQLNEPERAPLTYTYSDWGEILATAWTDGTTTHSLNRTYDSRSRVLSADERSNGVIDPYTVLHYTYDAPISLSPLVTPGFVTGQLASATSVRGSVAFSYDSFGRVNARTFTDEQSGIYIDRETYHADGSLNSLVFNLPDAGYAPEVAQYSYDSAARLRKVTYSDTTGSRDLYNASNIDVFGRLTLAQFGATAAQASYAPTGRKLIQESVIRSPFGSRRTIFGQFDPQGRELTRQEISDDSASGPTTTLAYDALGRLATANQTSLIPNNENVSSWAYEYDPLGNIHSLTNKARNSSTTLTYDTADRDRVCHISYADNKLGVFLYGAVENMRTSYLPCNVKYDASGSIVTEPARHGGTRQLDYFASGKVRNIIQGNERASFAYDAFGSLQTLDIDSAQGGHHDRHYGELIELHYASSKGPQSGNNHGGSPYRPGAISNTHSVANASFVTRNIPGPSGILASRRGSTGEWIYAFGESRGTRLAVNQSGTFVQKVDYQPYGESKSTGAAVGTPDYTGYQWNGGDALSEFGLARLGARFYDPEIGRFLSRDPLLATQSATSSNPYAFGASDPWNISDPSGLCIGVECDYLNSLAPLGIGLLIGGVEELASSGNGGHGYGSPQAAPPLGPGPQTQAGIQLQADTYAAGAPLAPVGWAWDKLAEYHFTAAEVIERLNNVPERDAEVDAYNARIDRGEHYVRVGGLAVAGSALLIAGGAALLPALTGPATASVVAGGGGALTVFEPEIEEGVEVAGTRGLGQYTGIFTPSTNAAGGQVWTATGDVTQNEFAHAVNSGLIKGDVNILSGVHGFANGTIQIDTSLYANDLARFGSLVGVNIIQVTPDKIDQIGKLLNGPGTTIAGFCWSGICLEPLR